VGIDVAKIESRTKTTESFCEKALSEDKLYTDPFKDITDTVGIRIICFFDHDVERVCQEIRRIFEVNEHDSIEKRPSFDQLGYKSNHLIVSLG
jgi:ppGpp synthetase/RelA/SpoT-type nucleotidyltranferase